MLFKRDFSLYRRYFQYRIRASFLSKLPERDYHSKELHAMNLMRENAEKVVETDFLIISLHTQQTQ